MKEQKTNTRLSGRLRRAGDKGISLLEVLFSLTLIVIVFVYLMSIFPTSAKVVSRDKRRLVASVVARNILNAQRQNEFDKIVSQKGTHVQQSTIKGRKTTRRYYYQLIIKEEKENLKNVQVNVSWHQGGRQRVVILQSLIFRR